jgi:uncharacterized protein YjdB
VIGGCGGQPPAPTLVSLSVSPSNPSLIVGDTQQFTAAGVYSNGSSQNLTSSVTWSSSNTQVVTISATGLATVQAAGTATITAASGTISGGTTLKASPNLESISVSPQSTSIPLGTSQQFKATGAYSDGSSQDLTNSVTWNSSNLAVATINTSGLATGVATGAATISASTNSVSGTASLAVGPPVAISVTPGAVSLGIGQTQQFTVSVTNTANAAVTWAVDSIVGGNATVGTISSAGLYQAPATSGMHQVSAMSQEDPTKSAQAAVTVAYQGIFTYHNDNARTGQNLSETTLTPANVNSTQFGKLFSYPVDGAIYAQPLYAASVTVPGQGVHNVVYVATQHDSVYAFDADGKSSAPLWQVSFINPSAGVNTVSASAVSDDAFPTGEIGITSTPVIDPVGGTLYVVAYTDENGQYVYRLHALDLTSGAEKFGGPAVIQASVSGTGISSSQGQVAFDPMQHLQRPGLLLFNGSVYIGFGSHGDTPPWHGWLLAYDATTLHHTAVFNVTPNGSSGAIWESGGAPAVDASGSIYVATGNGTFDVDVGGQEYGDSVLKLDPGTLGVLDWFTPFNEAYLCSQDIDLGSGGVMLLPDQPGPHPHLLLVSGKEGRIYVLDRDNLGGFVALDAQIPQELFGALVSNFSTPAYWQGNVYFVAFDDRLKMFTLTNGVLSTLPVALSPEYFGYAGATPSISANGSSNAILWMVHTGNVVSGGPAGLYVYQAANVSIELYNSTQVPSRDTLGPATKFTVPTVINGKVYVGTATELDVLGLLSP